MDLSILNRKDAFIRQVIERLGEIPLDYSEKMGLILAGRNEERRHLAAGVMLLLHFREGEFFFQLIKRSEWVAQPGDLSCPGGMLLPVWDPLLKRFVKWGWPPVMADGVRDLARRRGKETFDWIALILANALRESWEEIRLSPFNVRFLGPLPTHSLILFRRTIFPLLGLVGRAWPQQFSGEVERLVEIPLRAFWDQGNFRPYAVKYTDTAGDGEVHMTHFPCFVQGGDILWGATFYIIVHFLEWILDYRLPDWESAEPIPRIIQPDYLTGNRG